MENIPILDVKKLTENEQDLKCMAAQIKDAFTRIGFIALINHNICTKTVDDAWKVLDKFFALPLDTKLKYKKVFPGKLGYSAVNSETLYRGGQASEHDYADFKEGWEVYTNGLTDAIDFPDEIPEFKSTVDCVNKEFNKLGLFVCKLLALALELEDPDYFVKCHDFTSPDNLSVVKFIQYPPIPTGGLADGQMRCGKHTDFGTISLLIQDDFGGLEVQRRDGTWIETHPPPNTVMVNIGDLMQRWTSDIFVSNYHRVKEPKDEHLKNRTRKSLVNFINANGNTMVESLDGSNKYPPISTEKYLAQRITDMIKS